MKNLFCLGLAFLASVQIAKSQAIEFDTLEVDLGSIAVSEVKDGKVTYDFKFTNTGDKPFSVWRVLSSCGSKVTFDKGHKYEAGESGSLHFEAQVSRFRELNQFFTIDVYSTAKNYGIQKGLHNLKVSFKVDKLSEIEYDSFSLSKDSTPSNYKYAPSDVFETILGRVAEELRDTHYNKLSDDKVATLVSMLQSDGSYAHIDYDCFFRTNWQPVEHIEAIRAMSISYTEPQSKYYQDQELFAAIHAALEYWLSKSPQSQNWWYNEIGGSQVMADLLSLLSTAEVTIDSDMLRDLCHTISNSDPAKYTGANKLDVARHTLYRGCLLKDSDLVSFATSELFYAVRITSEEGIQEDMAYHQHGAQLYIGGYGIVFADGISQMAAILVGTPYELDSERVAVFSKFLREGYFKVFRGQYMDWSVVGRSVSRRNILGNRESASLILDRMVRVDPSHADEYQAIKSRVDGSHDSGYKVESENIAYYRTDYMVHNCEEYQATVRSASTRMMKAENGNGENLLSTYLSDGAFNIRQRGDEYNNILAFWQWDKIPGVTSPLEVYPLATSWRTPGVSTQTGGVSNGRVGAFAYHHDDHGLVAKKGWFFFDGFVVALGAGIKADSVDLHTTLDQCYLNGDVVVASQDGRLSTYNAVNDKLLSPSYVLHSDMCYMPLMDGALQLEAGSRVGNWNKINYNQRNKDITADLFTLVWQHPYNNATQQYAYIQVPNCERGKDALKIKRNLQFVNNEQKQVVTYGDTTMALMYDESSFEVDGATISVDRPSLVIVEKGRKSSAMSVVNLSGDSKAVKVVVSKRGKKDIAYSVETEVMKSSQIKIEKL